MSSTPFVPNNQSSPQGAQSSLNINQFDFQDFTYPEDLGATDSNGKSLYGHWMTFFINESSNTQFSAIVPSVSPNTTTSNPLAQVISSANPNSSTLTQSQLNQNNAANGSASANNSQTTTRAPLAISLYMPPQIATSYSPTWENQETGLLGQVEQAWETNKSMTDIMKSLGGVGIHQVTQDILKAGNAFTDSVGAGSFSGAILGPLRLAINPHAEFLFRGMGFRSFEFNFEFLPRNENEAIAANNIIQAFKFYSAPEIASAETGPFWIYPATFDLQFYSNGKINNYMNKISTCALVEMTVNYTGNQMFTSFYPGTTLNGVTTKTLLRLKFCELEILHKKLVQSGF